MKVFKIGIAIIVIALSVCSATVPSHAQQSQLPTKEQLAKDNKLCLTLATKALHGQEPHEPFHIAGPLYFVGTKGLSSFLFATSDGLILLNSGDPTSGPMIEASIRELGFDPKAIRIMINGHGHSDHAGGFAYLKKLSGATLAIMEGDVAMVDVHHHLHRYGQLRRIDGALQGNAALDRVAELAAHRHRLPEQIGQARRLGVLGHLAPAFECDVEQCRPPLRIVKILVGEDGELRAHA